MKNKSEIEKILVVAVIVFLSSAQVVSAGASFSTINTSEKATLNDAKVEVKTGSTLSVDVSKTNPDLVTNTQMSLPSPGSIYLYHERYAVIIVGGYNEGGSNPSPPQESYHWFTLSVRNMYDILTNSTYNYNFTPDHIFILLTLMDGQEFEENLSFDPNEISIYDTSTEDNIKNVFNKFKSGGDCELDGNDFLLVEVIAHGMDLGWWVGGGTDFFPNCPDTYFGLEELDTDGEDYGIYENLIQEGTEPAYSNNLSKLFSPHTKIWDWELTLYTSSIHAKRTIFILQPCFSGGFIKELSREDRVIITASRENEIAGDFLGPFERGLKGEQYAPGVDRNNDGKISLEEAFYYAGSNVPRPGEDIIYHPLIDDNGDGVGHEYNQYCGDRYLAAGIYYFKYEKINNYPPAEPQRPWEAYGNGSSLVFVVAGQECLFSTVTNDPEGDQVFYRWHWYNNIYDWIGPYQSGYISDGSYTWDQIGIYYVKVKAKDTQNYESDWSEPLTVVVLPGIFNELPQELQYNMIKNLELSVQENLVANSESATLMN